MQIANHTTDSVAAATSLKRNHETPATGNTACHGTGNFVLNSICNIATDLTVVTIPARGPSHVRQSRPPLRPVTPSGPRGASGAGAPTSAGEVSAGG